MMQHFKIKLQRLTMPSGIFESLVSEVFLLILTFSAIINYIYLLNDYMVNCPKKNCFTQFKKKISTFKINPNFRLTLHLKFTKINIIVLENLLNLHKISSTAKMIRKFRLKFRLNCTKTSWAFNSDARFIYLWLNPRRLPWTRRYVDSQSNARQIRPTLKWRLALST